VKVLAQRAFGDHEIVIFAGYATALDTAAFTVRVTDGLVTYRVGCSTEDAARSIANDIWRQLRAGESDLRSICRAVAK
jgi:hypothetical protein